MLTVGSLIVFVALTVGSLSVFVALTVGSLSVLIMTIFVMLASFGAVIVGPTAVGVAL